MAFLPSLGELKPSHLQPIDAPSTVWERTTERYKPWRMAIEQFIKTKADRLVYQVKITVMDGVLSKHRAMVEELDAKFDPVFAAAGFGENHRSGVALHKCSMPSASTIEWLYEKPWDAPMPPGGVPPANDLPGSSGYEFLKLTLGITPVLNESSYVWEIAPGIPDMVRRSEWVLTRTGDVGEEDMGVLKRGLRGLGFGECPSRR